MSDDHNLNNFEPNFNLSRVNPEDFYDTLDQIFKEASRFKNVGYLKSIGALNDREDFIYTDTIESISKAIKAANLDQKDFRLELRNNKYFNENVGGKSEWLTEYFIYCKARQHSSGGSENGN